MEFENRIEDIKEKAAEAEAESTPFMEPGTRVGKKRGKYKKRAKEPKPQNDEKGRPEKEPSPQPSPPTAEILKPVIALGGHAIARWADTPKALPTPNELDVMAQATGQLIDKWVPSVLDKWGPEVLFVIVFGQYGLRVASLKRERDQEKGVGRQTISPDHAPFHPESQSEPEKTVVPTTFSLSN